MNSKEFADFLFMALSEQAFAVIFLKNNPKLMLMELCIISPTLEG